MYAKFKVILSNPSLPFQKETPVDDLKKKKVLLNFFVVL